MAKYRVTHHSGVGAGVSFHNDRSRIREAAALNKVIEDNHIDLERIKDDKFIVLDVEQGKSIENPSKPFHEYERAFYEKYYGPALEKTNANYIKNRHPEHCKTIDDLLAEKLPSGKANPTAPEEIILQIGDKDNHPSPEVFEKCLFHYLKLVNEWNKENGNHIHLLDVAIHNDEATPHAHIRRVIDYIGEDGLRHIGQTKGLEQAGIELPDPTANRSRHNTYKMTFDQMSRDCFQNVCKYYGLDIELEVKEPGRKHIKDKEEYIAMKLEQQEQYIKDLEKEAKELYKQSLDNLDTNKNLQALVVGVSRALGKEDDYLYKLGQEQIDKTKDFLKLASFVDYGEELTNRIAHKVAKDLNTIEQEKDLELSL